MKKIKWQPGCSCVSALLAEKEEKGHTPSEAEIRYAAESCAKDRLYTQTSDFEYRICPCNQSLHHPVALQLVRASQLLTGHGVLPYSGGLMDQPAVLMELIEIVSILLQKIETEDRPVQKNTPTKKR
jgi:hypothetical protein